MAAENKLPFGLGLKYPAVLIFGAGATRGGLLQNSIPPPVDKDFFDIAGQLSGRGTRELAKRVLKSVWELYGKTTGVGLEQYYQDVETRAAIGEIAKSRNQPKDWNKRKVALEELIRRVYIHTTIDLTKTPPEPQESEVHRLVLKQLREDCTVITFNYDLLIEESVESEIWNPKDGYGMRTYGTSMDWCRNWLSKKHYEYGSRSKIHLLKLHGSLGWTLYNNQNIRLKARPYVVRKGDFENVSVLPPGWNKRIDKNPFKKFWREARLKLERCKSLMILGYSLPETDLLARSLFAEVVRSRASREEYLNQLYLIDPLDSVKDRFVSLMTPALGPYGTVYKFGSMQDLKSKLKENAGEKA